MVGQNSDSNKVELSFVVATFNSERHLLALCSNISESAKRLMASFEIMAIDGGSTDGTLQLAKELGMRVINNPHGNAIAAKHIGLWAAQGRLVCFMDHDERFRNVETVVRAVRTFEAEQNVRAIMTSGYYLERTESGSNWYASEFGDPVSMFLYRTPNRYEVREATFLRKFDDPRMSDLALIVDCAKRKQPLLCELVAAASFVDASFLRSSFEVELRDPNNLPQIFYFFGGESDRKDEIAILKDCPVHHDSVSSWKEVRAKVRWRVSNAVSDHEGIRSSGLEGRGSLERQWDDLSTGKSIPKNWKLLFLIYGVTLIGPIVDAITLSVRRRRMSYMMHVPLTLYVVYAAGLMKLKGMLGFSDQKRRYDGTIS